MNKGRLPRLAVPEAGPREAEAFPVSRREVAAWFDGLPKADLPVTASVVIEALERLNRQRLAPAARLGLLQQFAATAEYLAQGLRRRYQGQPFPLSERCLETAALERSLHRGLATGYKILVHDHARSRLIPRLARTSLLGAVHGAMGNLVALLLDYYRVYHQHEQGIWLDLNQLYRYAELRGLLRAPLGSASIPPGADLCLNDLYLRITLLSLASPYRLRQGEAQWVFDALGRWVRHCAILPSPLQGLGEGMLSVDLERDTPPQIQPAGVAMAADDCRVIDTSEMLPLLRRELSDVHETKTRLLSPEGERLSEDIYKRLFVSWSTVPQRFFSRNERSQRLKVFFGLNSVYRALSAGADDGADGPLAANPEMAIVPDDLLRSPGEYVFEEHDQDIWSLVYPRDPSRAAVWGGERHDHGAPPASHDCGTVNESAGGLCLTFDRRSTLRTRVGDLVGMRTPGREAAIEIGVVRWLKEISPTQLECGIQMLAPSATAALAIAHDATDAEEPACSLLMAQVPALRQPSTLVTSVMPFRTGSAVRLEIPGHSLDIRLTRLLESTGLFAQFQFGPLRDGGTTPETGTTQPK